MKTGWIYTGLIGIILLCAVAILGTINYEYASEAARWVNEDDGFYHDGGLDCPDCLEYLEPIDSIFLQPDDISQEIKAIEDAFNCAVQDGTLVKE